jgi:NADH-quinone oxidoreductase subunit J
MIIQALAFYVFAAVLIASAAMVITARNPVHSVLFLILAFFQAAGLAVLLGAEFLAMILIIVYVGAVAVLFLFVVMMLDVNFSDLRTGGFRYLPVGGLVGLVLLAELVILAATWKLAPDATTLISAPAAQGISNTQAIGRLIYTDYVYLFQASGLVLLIAMIGAIVLTLRSRPDARHQNIDAQITRKREDAVSVRKVASGEGVTL